MEKIKDKILFVVALMCTMLLSSCGGGDSDGGGSGGSGGMLYDVLDVNNTKYACFGYKSWATYPSKWNLSTHSGVLRMPCGLLSLAEKGEYDYCYMYEIYISGTKNLANGSRLEDFSPNIEYQWNKRYYTSGSATVIDITDRYITVKYDSFKFGSGSSSYTLNGTVQLDLEYEGEDSGGGGSTPSTYNMNVDIDANASSKTIELTNLNTSVSTVTSSASWLTVSKQSYSSGSPKIQIQATANTSTSNRSCTVTVTATDGNKVIIAVTQKGNTQPEVHEEISDQKPLSVGMRF